MSNDPESQNDIFGTVFVQSDGGVNDQAMMMLGCHPRFVRPMRNDGTEGGGIKPVITLYNPMDHRKIGSWRFDNIDVAVKAYQNGLGNVTKGFIVLNNTGGVYNPGKSQIVRGHWSCDAEI